MMMMAAMMAMDPFASPFSVPIAGCAVGIVAIVAGVWGEAHRRRLIAEQRMTMLARGIPLAEVEAVLTRDRQTGDARPVADPLRRLANTRRTAMVLLSSGAGLALFFVILTIVLKQREILSGAAVGVIPFVIGMGFLADYGAQKRDLEREVV